MTKNTTYEYLFDTRIQGYRKFFPANSTHHAICLENIKSDYHVIPFFEDFNQYSKISVHFTEEAEYDHYPFHISFILLNPPIYDGWAREVKVHVFFEESFECHRYEMQIFDKLFVKEKKVIEKITSVPLTKDNIVALQENVKPLLVDRRSWEKDKQLAIEKNVALYEELDKFIDDTWNLAKEDQTPVNWQQFIDRHKLCVQAIDMIERYTYKKIPKGVFYRTSKEKLLNHTWSSQPLASPAPDQKKILHAAPIEVEEPLSLKPLSKLTHKSSQKPQKKIMLPSNIGDLIQFHEQFFKNNEEKTAALFQAIENADIEEVKRLWLEVLDLREPVSFLIELIDSYPEDPEKMDALIAIADFFYAHSMDYAIIINLRKKAIKIHGEIFPWRTKCLLEQYLNENLAAFKMYLRQGSNPNFPQLFIQTDATAYNLLPFIIAEMLLSPHRMINDQYKTSLDYIQALLTHGGCLTFLKDNIEDSSTLFYTKHLIHNQSFAQVSREIEKNAHKKFKKNLTAELRKIDWEPSTHFNTDELLKCIHEHLKSGSRSGSCLLWCMSWFKRNLNDVKTKNIPFNDIKIYHELLLLLIPYASLNELINGLLNLLGMGEINTRILCHSASSSPKVCYSKEEFEAFYRHQLDNRDNHSKMQYIFFYPHETTPQINSLLAKLLEQLEIQFSKYSAQEQRRCVILFLKKVQEQKNDNHYSVLLVLSSLLSEYTFQDYDLIFRILYYRYQIYQSQKNSESCFYFSELAVNFASNLSEQVKYFLKENGHAEFNEMTAYGFLKMKYETLFKIRYNSELIRSYSPIFRDPNKELPQENEKTNENQVRL